MPNARCPMPDARCPMPYAQCPIGLISFIHQVKIQKLQKTAIVSRDRG
ncbi:MAG: hypothetical protein F6J93_30455 [Oscillatoria sp. SIO1A7]|nr:hypothetical protein [Oscillatoria sp. SIO1A7]